MKAAFIEHTGDASGIRFDELSMPRVGPLDVLVRVEAVAVNHVDTLIRSGRYPLPLPMPFIIGRDMVGTVERIGSGVQPFNIGNRVWSNCLGIEGLQGTFAEFIAAPAERLFHLPDGIEAIEAVAILHSGLTAAMGLFSKTTLRAGETLFVNGGSSSVGLAVLHVAKSLGARVAVTAGDEEKAKRCREAGAEVVVDYRHEDIWEAIKGFAPNGLDMYWEIAPGINFERLIPLMAREGRIIFVTGGDEPLPFPARAFYLRNLSLHGFTVTGASISELRACAERINTWLSSGVLKAPIQAVLPLADAAKAHSLQEAGGLTGKLVLTP
ncbi:MAG: NADPH:quinone reductase [Kiritimatiellae bacterium]|nr:NADPH:quinone reductase [Kiritimatiellia bacterium]